MRPPTNSWSARSGSSPDSRTAGAIKTLYTASKLIDPPAPSGFTPNGITMKQRGRRASSAASAGSVRDMTRLYNSHHVATIRRPLGFANSSATLPERFGLARFVALCCGRGRLFALVVRVSRCPESVRVGVADGTAASLEGAGDSRPPARAGDPPSADLAAEADAGPIERCWRR